MPTLQRGSSGSDVQALQQRLSDLGFDPNGIDGNFGPGTEKAVRAFQQAKGLGVDGKAGPDTLAALNPGDLAANATAGMSGGNGSTSDSTSNSTPVVTPADAPNLNLAGLTGKVPDGVIAQIPEAAKDFNITSNLRLAHFLAQ